MKDDTGLTRAGEQRRLLLQAVGTGALALATASLVHPQATNAEESDIPPQIAMRKSVDISQAPSASESNVAAFPFSGDHVEDSRHTLYLATIIKDEVEKPTKPENEIWAEHIQTQLKNTLGVRVDLLTIDPVFLERTNPSNLDTVLTAIITMFDQVQSSSSFKARIPKLSFEPTPADVQGARTGHIYDNQGNLLEIKVQFSGNGPFQYEGIRDATGGVGLFANEMVHVLGAHITAGNLDGQGEYRGRNPIAEAISNIGHDLLDVKAKELGLPSEVYDTENERAATDHYADTGIFTEITGAQLPPGIPSFVIGSLDKLHNLPLRMFNTLAEAIGMRLAYEFAQNGVPLKDLLEAQTHIANKDEAKIPTSVRTVLDKFVNAGLIAGKNTPTFPANVIQQITLVRPRPEEWVFTRPNGSEVSDMFQVDIATLMLQNNQMQIGTGIGSNTWVLGEWTDPSGKKFYGGVHSFLWEDRVSGTNIYNYRLMCERYMTLQDGRKISLDDNVKVTLHTEVEGKSFDHKFDFSFATPFDPNSRPPTPKIN